jgi:uncharacterized membrane protein YdfJ with MMPL/SSD domain
MKRSLFLVVAVAIVAGLLAWATASIQHHKKAVAAENASVIEVDSQRIAHYLADLVRQSDLAVVFDLTGPTPREVRLTDQAWLDRLESALRESTYRRQSTQVFVMPTAALELRQEDETLLRLDLHSPALLGVAATRLNGQISISSPDETLDQLLQNTLMSP